MAPVNGKFNRKVTDFNKEGKKKTRDARKLAGTVLKHKKSVKAVSAVRTKKHQRKMAHKQRMLEKVSVAEVAAAAEDMEMQDVSKARARQAKKAEKNTMQE